MTTQEPNGRDPLMDPTRGDDVAGQTKRGLAMRFVVEFVVEDGRAEVWYRRELYGPRFTCSLAAWRRWCRERGAVVEHTVRSGYMAQREPLAAA